MAYIAKPRAVSTRGRVHRADIPGYRRQKDIEGHPSPGMKFSGSEYPVNRAGRVRCCSQNRVDKLRCMRWAVHGGNLCELHGGVLLPPDVRKAIKMGRYEESIQNETLRDKYRKLTKDVALTDMNEDLALLRAMTEVVVERATGSVDDAGRMRLDGVNAVTLMLRQVDSLVESITTRELQLKLTVPVKALGDLMDKVVDILYRHVQDAAVMQKIAQELAGLELPAAGNQTAQNLGLEYRDPLPVVSHEVKPYTPPPVVADIVGSADGGLEYITSARGNRAMAQLERPAVKKDKRDITTADRIAALKAKLERLDA